VSNSQNVKDSSINNYYFHTNTLTYILTMAKTTAGESQRSTYSLETAGNFHFLAALYFEPSAALTMRCVLGSKPRFALLTKYSCTLQNSNTQMQVTTMSTHAEFKRYQDMTSILLIITAAC